VALVFPFRAHTQRLSRSRSLLTSLAVSLGGATVVVATTATAHALLDGTSGYGRTAGTCFLRENLTDFNLRKMTDDNRNDFLNAIVLAESKSGGTKIISGKIDGKELEEVKNSTARN